MSLNVKNVYMSLYVRFLYWGEIMLTAPDFNKKQIVFIFANYGEKIAFGNDNLIVKDKDGKIKLQITCYRVFLVFVIGNCSITTVIIQRAKKFGIRFALMNPGFKLYSIIGAEKDGNFLLREKQYAYEGADIARHIIYNKIDNQIQTLKLIRNKTEFERDSIVTIKEYQSSLRDAYSLSEIMAYEGLASKRYFACQFCKCNWQGRQPRLKRDIINSTLDIGYTILFAFIEALLSCFGFDLYRGVLHRQFYMRKSLVCDLVEPFRCLIDDRIKHAYNLGQIKNDDFIIINGQYQLKWEESSKYVQFLIKPLIDRKEDIFTYILKYYRAFMKESEIENYPMFRR